MNIPIWLPWTFIGGVLFIVLSFLASKYNNKTYTTISSLQDFISGAILTSFTGILMPDLFPILSDMIPILPLPSIMTSGGTMEDVQVAPPLLLNMAYGK